MTPQVRPLPNINRIWEGVSCCPLPRTATCSHLPESRSTTALQLKRTGNDVTREQQRQAHVHPCTPVTPDTTRHSTRVPYVQILMSTISHPHKLAGLLPGQASLPRLPMSFSGGHVLELHVCQAKKGDGRPVHTQIARKRTEHKMTAHHSCKGQKTLRHTLCIASWK